MYKLNYKLPVPRITKTALFVTASLLVIFGLIAYGAVRNEQEKHRQAVITALQQQQAAADKKATDLAAGKVQSDLNAQTNKALAACGVLKQYSVAPATSRLVKYPPVCNVK